MSDILRAILPALLFFLAIWSLVWDDIAGAGGIVGLHYLPDIVAIAASVLAATASMSGSNPGWKIVFHIVLRIALILFAVDLGNDSYLVSQDNHIGRLVLGIMVHIAIAAVMLLLVFFAPPSRGGANTSSHDWSEAVRSFLTPMRNTIAHLVIILILVGAAVTGFIIHCVVVAQDKFPASHTAANFFSAAFIIMGYLGALLLGGASAFFFLSGGSSEILEHLHSAISALATFLIAFSAGYWANQSNEADAQVAAVVMDAIVIVGMLFLSVVVQLSPFASQSYEPIGDAKPPVRA